MNSLYALVAILIAATAFGVWRKVTEGRARIDSHRLVVTAVDIGQPLGERATLLQFSSAFCSPCRTTKIILGKTAVAIDGVAHIEVDAESHLELVRRLDIRRTPTTLILDSKGVVTNRAVGVPRHEELIVIIAEAAGV